jgi:hypothetical protein
MEKNRPGEDEIEIHFQLGNDSPAAHPGQREGSQLPVTPVTGGNRTLSGNSGEVRGQKQEAANKK